MKPNQQAKRIIIDELKDKIARAKSFVVIDYMGLTVEKDTQVRKSFRAANVEYGVHKNTLLRIALNEAGYNQYDDILKGPTALAISYEDEIAAAKATKENIDKNPSMKIKCGMMNGDFVDAKTVEAMANIPSKPVLLGMLANVLNAPIQGLAIALKAVADKQEA